MTRFTFLQLFRTILRSSKAAIDLASIMVGIIVIGVIGGVIAATVFAVIPWAQDNAAKASLGAVVTAESAYRGFTADAGVGRFGNQAQLAGDVSAPVPVQNGPVLKYSGSNLRVTTPADGFCYLGVIKSDSGNFFFVTNSDTTPKKYVAGVSVSPCGDLDALVGELGGSTTPGFVLKASVISAKQVSSGISITVNNSTVTPSPITHDVYRKVTGAPSASFKILSRDGNGSVDDTTVSEGVSYDYYVISSFETFKSTSNTVTAVGPNPYQMVMTFNTAISGCSTVKLPMRTKPGTTGDVRWGDGSTGVITATNGTTRNHTYAAAGVYTVSYSGQFSNFEISPSAWSPTCLTSITKWNGTGTTDLIQAFQYTTNLVSVAEIPSTVTNIGSAFYNNATFNGDISGWDTSNVTLMGATFYGASAFNGDITGWNTSNVVSLFQTFYNAKAFNRDISNWDTSSVELLHETFLGATSFNQPVGKWSTASLTDANFTGIYALDGTFQGATSFNQPLNNWDVSRVVNLTSTFQGATAFNQPLNSWNVSKVTKLTKTFQGASAFNQSLSSWNTGLVTSMDYVFNNAVAFNGDITGWNTANVTTMLEMFYNAKVFNQPIGGWNVGKVKVMNGMFRDAAVFNQPLNNWNVSTVTDMRTMFYNAKVFNQPLNNWNTVSVNLMDLMFSNASVFSQDLSGWNVNAVGTSNHPNFSTGSALTAAQLPKFK